MNSATDQRPLAQVQARFRQLPTIDRAAWTADQATADELFGTDDPFDSPGWAAAEGADGPAAR